MHNAEARHALFNFGTEGGNGKERETRAASNAYEMAKCMAFNRDHSQHKCVKGCTWVHVGERLNLAGLAA